MLGRDALLSGLCDSPRSRELVRVGLVTDVFNRTHTAEEVQHPAGLVADISKLMPVTPRDDEYLVGSDLERASEFADKLQGSTERHQNHVGVGVPVHVVDESGREGEKIRDNLW